MNGSWRTIAAATIGLAAAPAGAVDMAAINCRDLANMRTEDQGTVLVWLHGYVAGKRGETNFDIKAFERVAKELGVICAGSPGTRLLAIAEQLVK